MTWSRPFALLVPEHVTLGNILCSPWNTCLFTQKTMGHSGSPMRAFEMFSRKDLKSIGCI